MTRRARLMTIVGITGVVVSLAYVQGGRAAIDAARQLGAESERRLAQVYRSVGDTRTETAVQAALALDGELSGQSIDVSVESGVVRLQGVVSTPEVRETAATVAASVSGASEVHDELTVEPSLQVQRHQPSLADAVADRTLATETRLALALRRDLRGSRIGVQAHRGQISLEGHVGSEAERELAIRVASRVPGVASVEDRLHLDQPTPQPPSESEQLARASTLLSTSPSLEGAALTVERVGHHLRLSGTVASPALRELAWTLVRLAGPAPVENHVEVVVPVVADVPPQSTCEADLS